MRKSKQGCRWVGLNGGPLNGGHIRISFNLSRTLTVTAKGVTGFYTVSKDPDDACWVWEEAQ